jgi:hypothetical protein
MKTRFTTDKRLVFWCPGCKEAHGIPTDKWQWNGQRDTPTLIPSVLTRSGHFALPGGPCWCTYKEKYGADSTTFSCVRCHLFLTDGQLQFLSDCSHEYAGRAVALEEWDTHD